MKQVSHESLRYLWSWLCIKLQLITLLNSYYFETQSKANQTSLKMSQSSVSKLQLRNSCYPWSLLWFRFVTCESTLTQKERDTQKEKTIVSNITFPYNYPLKINNNHVKKQKTKHNTLCYWKAMFLPKIQESWKPIYQWRFPSKYIYDPCKQYWYSKL